MGIIKPFKFSFEDRKYEFDGKMTIDEAILLQDKARVTPLEVFSALQRLEPKAVLAFVYIVKRRKPYNEAVQFEDLLSADIYTFLDEVEDDQDEEENAEQAPADPPGAAAGRTRKGGTSKTAST